MGGEKHETGEGKEKDTRVKMSGKDNTGNWAKRNKYCELEFFRNALGRILKRG